MDSIIDSQVELDDALEHWKSYNFGKTTYMSLNQVLRGLRDGKSPVDAYCPYGKTWRVRDSMYMQSKLCNDILSAQAL